MKQILILFLALASSNLSASLTGDRQTDRTVTYGILGGFIGAVAGNQVDGDHSSEIGAGVGTIAGVVLANVQNSRERAKQAAVERQWIEEQRRREQAERSRNISLGRTVTDRKILEEEHRVEKLENEVARIIQERAEAEERARRIRELRERKAQLEKELRDLKRQ